jgi:hypothetical protein
VRYLLNLRFGIAMSAFWASAAPQQQHSIKWWQVPVSMGTAELTGRATARYGLLMFGFVLCRRASPTQSPSSESAGRKRST